MTTGSSRFIRRMDPVTLRTGGGARLFLVRGTRVRIA
nr:MAG TPA: hypothetical protein [Caudoviricetes sp.]